MEGMRYLGIHVLVDEMHPALSWVRADLVAAFDEASVLEKIER